MHNVHTVFLYCSAGERSVKFVRPALEMQVSKEEQRGVVSFQVAEGAASAIKSKRPGMLSDGIIPCMITPIPIRNLVRDQLQIFGWDTLQQSQYIPDLSPRDFHIFGDLKKYIRGSRFHSARKCKSGWGCGSISDLPLSRRLELIVSSLSGINT